MLAVEVISLAGTVCGVLDLSVTGTLFTVKAGSFERLLQGITSSALGKSAFTGGKKTATAGVFFHFVIAFSWAAIYYLLS